MVCSGLGNISSTLDVGPFTFIGSQFNSVHVISGTRFCSFSDFSFKTSEKNVCFSYGSDGVTGSGTRLLSTGLFKLRPLKR